ncbi:hypothetical protein C9374_014128 [Naegleria lovaniensis]|uniref:EML-like first beta-propeller domain-containing protein n=1 Tax=Naegleria lovaniensis TaxID=51637 RepID=A0AA88H019_NAELO|nr:uncharacterized protein C9374_014128 [Naegleria lovaniensis]KAG2389568.1 hypothetical protein C9374_014128 [Naegleria lovaniensis]
MAQLELEHAIGFSSKLPQSVLQHPKQSNCFVFISGSVAVMNDSEDPNAQRFMRGHDDRVSCLAFANHGHLIATGQQGENADVCLWDTSSLQLTQRLGEHEKCVGAVAFSHDDKLLATVGNASDRRLLIWNVSTGNIVASAALPKQTDDKILVCFGGMVRDIKKRETDRYLLATCSSGNIIIWSLEPYKGILEQEKVNTGAFVRDYTCMQFDKLGEYLFVGSASGDLSFIHVRLKRLQTAPVKICSSGVLSIVINPSNGHVITGGGDGSITIFDCQQIVKKQKISNNGGITSLSIFGSEFILAGTDDGEILKITLDKLESCLIARNHAKSIYGVDFPYGLSDKFATISENCEVIYWDVANYLPETQCKFAQTDSMKGSNVFPVSCAFIKDEISILLTGWSDGSIRAVDCETGEQLWTLVNAHRNAVTKIDTSHNNKFFVSAGQEGDVRVYAMKTRQLVCSFKEHSTMVTGLKIMRDDVHVFSSSKDREIFCYDLRNERRVASYNHKIGSVNGFVVCLDQETIISIGSDRYITYWNIASDAPQRIIPYSKKFEPKFITKTNMDDRLFAVFGNDEQIHVYQVDSGEKLASIDTEGQYIYSIQFSPDDKQLIGVGEGGIILMFNVY